MFYLRFYNLGLQSLITCVTFLDWSVKDLLTSLTNQRRHKSQHVVTGVNITTIHQSPGMCMCRGTTQHHRGNLCPVSTATPTEYTRTILNIYISSLNNCYYHIIHLLTRLYLLCTFKTSVLIIMQTRFARCIIIRPRVLKVHNRYNLVNNCILSTFEPFAGYK